MVLQACNSSTWENHKFKVSLSYIARQGRERGRERGKSEGREKIQSLQKLARVQSHS
jgi:predicted transposase YdaD